MRLFTTKARRARRTRSRPHRGWRRNRGRLGVVYSRWGRRSSPVGLTPGQVGRCRPSEARNDLPCRTYRLPPKGSNLPPARIVLPPQGNRLARGKIISRPNETSALSAKSTLAPRIPIRIPENHRSPPIFPSPRARDHLPGDQTIALHGQPAGSRQERSRWRSSQLVRGEIVCLVEKASALAAKPGPTLGNPLPSSRDRGLHRSDGTPGDLTSSRIHFAGVLGQKLTRDAIQRLRSKLYRLAKKKVGWPTDKIAGLQLEVGGNRRRRSGASRKTAQRTSFLNRIRCGWSAEVPFRLW